MGLYGRKYQWINWRSHIGIIPELNAHVNDGCSHAQMLEVTEGMFLIERKLISETDYNDTAGVTGKVWNIVVTVTPCYLGFRLLN